MKFTDFFVERPIFAVVFSVMLIVVGGIALRALPLSEYPAVSPPTVVVRAAYPGANPKVIAENVAAPLEQEINGVEGMMYMSSQATTDGRMNLTVTFEQGVDIDLAQVQVQNRVARVIPRLPIEVQRIGVVTDKTSPDMLMVAHITSPGGSRTPLYLSNFAMLNVRDELSRLDGVGAVNVYGAGEYSMRVWLDPQKLEARGLTASDAARAIREQNVQIAAGTLGQQPDPSSSFELAIMAQGRLTDEEQFRQIIVKAGDHGQLVRLGDVARVELGAGSYALRSLLDGKPAAAIQIIQAPGANALDVAASVRAKLAELAPAFPADVSYRVAYDPTLFVRASIDNVLKTLIEAVLLVVLVVVLFLQSWRASLIPVVAVPISLIGTAAVMHVLGFSLNTLSLFGLVLSIGIVVDDAIVVVENVERHLASGLDRKDAARRAMREVTGPIIAITSVLAAVFVPTAFLGGLTGQFYRQFAITIAISTILSAFVSLTLSPALAGVLLRSHDAKPDLLSRVIDRLLGRFVFKPFNRFFDASAARYVGFVKRTFRMSAVALAVYAGLLGLTWKGFEQVPKGFVPMQDKYYVVGIAQLPPASSLDRTEDVLRRASEIALAEPGIDSVVAFPGLSINGFMNAPNAGVFFAMLDPFEARQTEELSAEAITSRLRQKLGAFTEGFVGVFPPPPVPGLGALGGFKMQIEDRAGHGPEALYATMQALMGRAAQEPAVAGMLSSFDINVPQLSLEVDRERAKALGIPLHEIYDALQINLGSLYVNDFNRFGRTYRVNMQADAQFRAEPEDIGRLKVRNDRAQLASLGSLVRAHTSFGPDRAMRYNGYPSADVSGGAAPGFSTGQAVAAMEQLAGEVLPAGMTFEWTELTLQEKQAGDAGLLVFPLAVLLAYLILAAQYNSWSLPLAVLLIVPLALLSAIAGVWLLGGANDIFTQIGFVVLVGLAAKNAILIVEFAREKESEGRDSWSAALEACRLRLRPILMTSLAFIMGVIPLAFASGAGAEMRQAMGIAVLFGMAGVTLFGLVLTPVFYVVVRAAAERFASSGAKPVLSAAAALLIAVVGAAGATPALAQEQRTVRLSLDEALALALRNNLALVQAELESDVANARALAPRAAFDPVLHGRAEYVSDRSPPRVFAGPTGVESAAVEASVSQKTPWGTDYEVGYGVDHIDASGPATQPEPSYGARIRIALRQPLLRGAWGIPERGAVDNAERSKQIAKAVLTSETNAILIETAQAYFRLVRAREATAVARESRALAAELIAQTRAQVDVGTLERIELTQAEAGLALREESVILAETELANAREALARLILIDGQQTLATDIEPTQGLSVEAGEASLEQSLAAARENRPELTALELAVRNERTALGVAKNGELPDLALVGSLAIATSNDGLDGAHRELGTAIDDQARWSAGLIFSQPLGNRAAHSARRAAELSLRRTETALADARLQVEQDVRAAVRALDATARRIEATRRAEQLADEQLAAERQRLEAGASTAFEVLRLETDRSVARNARIRAMADHGVRVMDLQRATGALAARAR